MKAVAAFPGMAAIIPPLGDQYNRSTPPRSMGQPAASTCVPFFASYNANSVPSATTTRVPEGEKAAHRREGEYPSVCFGSLSPASPSLESVDLRRLRHERVLRQGRTSGQLGGPRRDDPTARLTARRG